MGEGSKAVPWLLGFIALTSTVTLILAAVVVGAGHAEADCNPNIVSLAPENQVVGLPGMEQLSWAHIEDIAKSQTLNFYLYSPNNSGSQYWVDQRLAPHLLSQYSIQVNRIDAKYTGCAPTPMAVFCDVQSEVAAGKTTTGGGVDLIWINGVNFDNMRKAGLLYGPWATLIPSAANYDFTDTRISLDKGVPIQGYEFPFNGAQTVFIANNQFVPNPPKSVPAFVDWVTNNPGRFAYPNPELDFTGAAFIRTLFYYYCGDAVQGGSYKDWITGFDEAKYVARVPVLWTALRAMKPNLYQSAGAPFFPNNSIYINPLMNLTANPDGIWLSFSWDATLASKMVESGAWSSNISAYLFDAGNIADTNYLAIPVNAAHKEAALVAVNHIGSPHSMFERSLTSVWGTLQVYNINSPAVKEWNVAFDHIAYDQHTPPETEMLSKARADATVTLVDRLNADWVTEVLNHA